MLVSLVLLLTIIWATACKAGGNTGQVRARPTPLPTSTPLPPLPTDPPPGSELNPIVFVMVNTEDADNLESKAEDLSDTFSNEAEMVVQVKVLDNYGEALSELCLGQAHVISAQAFAYLSAQERQCGTGQYIAEVDGELNTQGQMMTISGREIFTVKGFEGYRFCRPSASSLNGWIIPGLSLRKNLINPFTDLFSVTDSGSDQDVVEDLVTFRCDVGASALGAEDDVPNSGVINVVEVLPPVPNDTVMLTTALDTQVTRKVQELLDDHLDDLADLIGADNLEPSDDTQFDELRQLLDDANVSAASMGK